MQQFTKGISMALMAAFLVSCANQTDNKVTSTEDSTKNSTSTPAADYSQVAKNLAKFDTLDFNVFSHRDWSRFHESHADDVVVHFPDGHTTNGLKKHIEDMEAMFVYAPDTRITEHPIKIGQGNITAVTGFMEGTFTQPMPDGKGGFIQPTGNKFRIPMATVSVWKPDGTMSEEFLYWDNQTYMNQLMGK